MANKETMGDLKAVIKAVLEEAADNYNRSGEWLVRWGLLHDLQAEYNIYFVEPDAQQLDIV